MDKKNLNPEEKRIGIRVELGRIDTVNDGRLISFETRENSTSYNSMEWARRCILPIENYDEKSLYYIGDETIDDFIVKVETVYSSDQSITLKATLRNGFEVEESVTALTGFSEATAEGYCLAKIRTKVRHYLDFLLYSAANGFSYGIEEKQYADKFTEE